MKRFSIEKVKSLLPTLASIFFVSAPALAIEPDFCLKQSEKVFTCAFIPAETPLSVVPDAALAGDVKMLIQEDSSGAAAELETSRQFSASRMIAEDLPSLVIGENLLREIRYIELFLKSGPASGGSLEVIAAGRP